jgi:hypothetical protein
MATVRVLVVDDNAQFRRLVCSSLRTIPLFADYWRGIRRLRSGSESPGTATGSDSARYWPTEAKWNRSWPPDIPDYSSRFVSQISDADVVEESLSKGAKG